MRGGLSLLPGDEGSTPPARVEIIVAYDVRRGNPIKKYNVADFQVDSPPIRFDPPPEGVEVVECARNRVLAAIREPDFSLHITGFDEKRDLYVRAAAKEAPDASQTV